MTGNEAFYDCVGSKKIVKFFSKSFQQISEKRLNESMSANREKFLEKSDHKEFMPTRMHRF